MTHHELAHKNTAKSISENVKQHKKAKSKIIPSGRLGSLRTKEFLWQKQNSVKNLLGSLYSHETHFQQHCCHQNKNRVKGICLKHNVVEIIEGSP